ncbi:MAG TPA: hypothetical protein DG577_04430 [Firmicutes bacterium]|nr:hypothetical protein [Bacillota bacterium]HCX78641.1 hypothetical protein [Bacillota bacterium]
MNEQTQNAVFAYLIDEIAACQRRQKELLADNRDDEAKFEKIRTNVFDIFKTVLSVAIRTVKSGSSAEIKDFFLQKTEQIPANWKIAYAKAAEHGDVEKMHYESIKLEAIAEIRETFETIWGDK